MSIKIPILLSGLLVFLFISLVLNVFQYFQIAMLEEDVWTEKWRLSAFVGLTSELVSESGCLTHKKVVSSDLIGYPYKTGTGYVLDIDPHYDFGIKYFFDLGGRFVRWEEYPKIQILQDDGTGKMVDRNIDDIVYE